MRSPLPTSANSRISTVLPRFFRKHEHVPSGNVDSKEISPYRLTPNKSSIKLILAPISLLVIFLMLWMNMESRGQEKRIPVIKCEITGFIDFDKKRLWFKSSSEDRMLISLSGSVISLDDFLDVKSHTIKPYVIQQGCLWLMRIPNGKPGDLQGVEIVDFEKTNKVFEAKGFIDVTSPVYRITRDGKFSGPYILDKKIRVFKAKPEDIDSSRLLLIPFK